jgi:predicted methyltransferase
VPLSDRLVEDVARAVGLVEGVRGVQGLLAAIARLEPVSVRALGQAADLPVPIVAAICGELRRSGYVSETRPVQFTLAGRRRFGSGSTKIETACPGCGGRGVALPPPVAQLRRGLAAVAEVAPPPLVELDQCHCTPKTKLRRVLAMHAADAIAGRRILLLGDDDLISLTLLRFVRSFNVSLEELVVVDVDQRLIRFIAAELAGAPFAFRCVHADLRESLPGSFDTVVTDPPYTPAGAKLFLGRAREALAGEGANLFLSFGSRRPGVQFEVQRTIAELSLEIRSLRRDFNDYVGAGVLGGTSHLYHLTPAREAAEDDALYTGARRAPPDELDGQRPPYHAASVASGGKCSQTIASSQAACGADVLASGCGRLRPLCSISAPRSPVRLDGVQREFCASVCIDNTSLSV